MSLAMERSREAIAHLSPGIRWPIFLGTCLVATAFAAGWTMGSIGPESTRPSTAYAAGACMALEMAEAHLFIDDRAKMIIADALAGPLNLYQALLPARRSDILALCKDVRAGRLSIMD